MDEINAAEIKEPERCNQLIDFEYGFVPCQKCGYTHSKCPHCGIAVDYSRPLQSYQDWECGTKSMDGAVHQSILCKAICKQKERMLIKIYDYAKYQRDLNSLYENMNFDFVDKDERWNQIGYAIKQHSLTDNEPDTRWSDADGGCRCQEPSEEEEDQDERELREWHEETRKSAR